MIALVYSFTHYVSQYISARRHLHIFGGLMNGAANNYPVNQNQSFLKKKILITNKPKLISAYLLLCMGDITLISRFSNILSGK